MQRAHDAAFVAELDRIRAAGLERRLRPLGGAVDTWATLGDRRVLVLCSNNYLGLANHPALAEAAARAARTWGVGAGASRLISGSLTLHHALEERLADRKHTDAALLFPTGYHANVGTITALVGKGDAVFSDALNHASIIDGCRLSGAEVHVAPHADAGALAERLAASTARRKLVVTDTVFSMDGDHAPLAAICDAAEAYGAMVMVDEAHATGVLGPQGGGLVEALGLADRITVQMGTLGKALGCAGAFVAGSRPLVDLLVNRARTVIFTTALPPPVVAAVDAALDLVEREPERRTRLAALSTRLRADLRALGYQVPPGDTPIVPIIMGESERTMACSAALLEENVLVSGIRPPTVPKGTARLRVTLMATHTDEDVAHAVAAFTTLAKKGAIKP